MEDHPSIRQLMDEEHTSDDLEAKLKELEEDIEEIQGLLEKPESDGIQIIETEGGERQVIVHWLEDSNVTDLAGAESVFQNCDPISDPYAAGSSGREAGHGDLLVLDAGACNRYIAYVVNVDRVAPKHSGLQAEATTTGHALSIGTNPPRKELIIWKMDSHGHATVNVPNVSIGNTPIPVATFGTPVSATVITGVTPITAVTSVTPVLNTLAVTATANLTASNITPTANVTASSTTTPVVTSLDATTPYTTQTLTVDNSNGEILGVNTNNVYLPSATPTPVPNVTGAELVDPASLGNTHTYNVDVGTLKEVWEQEVQVCILDPNGYPTTCTLTILATSKTGTGCDDFSDPPDGWFFKPIDDDNDAATDSIPQITIPRDDVQVNYGNPIQVAVRDATTTAIATSLNRSTTKVTPSLPYNTQDVEIVTGVTLATTAIVTGTPTVAVSTISAVTGGAINVSIPPQSILTGVSTTPVQTEKYTSTQISIPQAGTASSVPDVSVSGTIPVAGAATGCP